MRKTDYIIFTDGSATTKGECLGGSGAYIKRNKDGKEFYLRKGLKYTKTGRTEINALLMALRFFDDKSLSLEIYSDSQYVVNSVSKGWAESWVELNDIEKKNLDLWREVVNEVNQYKKNGGKIMIFHIKGHSGILGNEIADTLADYKTQQSWDNDLINPLTMEEYDEEYGDKLMSILEQTRVTTELDFDYERELERHYNKYIDEVYSKMSI